MVSSIGSGTGLGVYAAAAADEAGVAVLKKALDASSNTTLQLLQGMPTAEPQKGSAFDILL